MTTALLCDFATVREELLHILGGGISMMARPELPAPLGVSLAFMLELDPVSEVTEHTIAVVIFDEEDKQVVEISGRLRRPSDLLPSEEAPFPVVALPSVLPLAGVEVQREGLHRLVIALDGVEQHTLWFRIVLAPDSVET